MTSPIRRPAACVSRAASAFPAASRSPTSGRSRRDAEVGELARDGAAARDRGKAAVRAALADRVGPVGDPDVADVAGAAVGSAVDWPSMTMPRADAGGDLDQAERARRGGTPRRARRARRRRRRWRCARARRERILQVLGDRVRVPAGHDRRLAGAARIGVDGAGQADPDPDGSSGGPVHRPSALFRMPAAGAPTRDRVERASGPLATATSMCSSPRSRAGEVGQRDRGCAWCRRRRSGRRLGGVELQAARAAAAGGAWSVPSTSSPRRAARRSAGRPSSATAR